MRPLFILTFLVSVYAWGDGVPAKPTPTLEQLVQGVKETEFTERLDVFSEKFLGTPFIANPLGEGAQGRFDQGPLFRFDGFDCTTLVETVVALSLSKTAKEFPAWMKKIRYRNGQIDFLTRNHFPCGDWIPNNSANGMLTDITEQLAGPLGTLDASAVETKKEWVSKLPKEIIRIQGADDITREKQYLQLQREASVLPPQKVSLKFIPLDKLLTRKPVAEAEQKRRVEEETAFRKKLEETTPPDPDNAKREAHIKKEVLDQRLKYLIQETDVDARFLADIPSGTLINFVRPNYTIPGTRLLISHQGLVFRKKGVPYFRHVSLSGGARTKEVPLANYLRLCLLLPSVHGIQTLKINDVRKASAFIGNKGPRLRRQIKN